jgi:hypothetical protein
VASLPVLAFLMLSGFLLRGDADAQQARRILEEMLGLLPLAGPRWCSFCWAATALAAGRGAAACRHRHPHRLAGGGGTRAAHLGRAARLGADRGGLWRPGAAGVAGPARRPDTALKGPWYFLGLQELLHWSSWPAWLLLAGAALLVLLAWMPDARPAAAVHAKRGSMRSWRCICCSVWACCLPVVRSGAWRPAGPPARATCVPARCWNR